MDRWNILYRGPLSSCNYGCTYCPFAKTKNTGEELADDAARLERFVSWVSSQKEQEIGILFTPWGEALIHHAYREAIQKISHLPHVYRVAIQTNLSARVTFLENCNLNSTALWSTYHPTQVKFDTFVSRCHELDKLGARYSVGVVGIKDTESEIQQLRDALPSNVYLWINAYKRDPDYYSNEQLKRLAEIDPHFLTNTIRHPSKGKNCSTGFTSFTIDGEGNARRCHFVEEPPFANIYKEAETFSSKLQPTTCPNQTCGCHIGYVQLESLGLDKVYGDGILERIPLSR